MTIRFYVTEDALAVAEALLLCGDTIVDSVEVHDVEDGSVDAYVDAHLYKDSKPNYFELGMVLGEQGVGKYVCYHKEI